MKKRISVAIIGCGVVGKRRKKFIEKNNNYSLIVISDIKFKKKKFLINEEIISSNLFTSKIPDPDLLIRTSGEKRLSNFLLWQLAYAEIHVTDVLWPDFDADALTKALLDYQTRRRRFGGV